MCRHVELNSDKMKALADEKSTVSSSDKPRKTSCRAFSLYSHLLHLAPDPFFKSWTCECCCFHYTSHCGEAARREGDRCSVMCHMCHVLHAVMSANARQDGAAGSVGSQELKDNGATAASSSSSSSSSCIVVSSIKAERRAKPRK